MNGENDTMYYIHKDYLGSYDVITNEGGHVLERLSFDPWGRRRNPADWTFDHVPANHLFDRGYTGHEHLDVFSLINMNGRVYDPWLGRFLSPDPFVQSPTYSQSYNRYSYCYNNPLKYTDPSGYTADIGRIIYDLWNSPHGGSWSESTGTYYYHSSEEAYNAGCSYQDQNGYSYQIVSKRNRGYNKKIYPWVVKNDRNYFHKEPVYDWVYTGETFEEGDLSMGDDWLFINTMDADSDGDPIDGILPTLAGAIATSVEISEGVSVTIGLSSTAIAAGAMVLPIILAGDTRVAKGNMEPYSYVTYTKFNPSTQQVYIGRTEGYGSPAQVLARREYVHHMNQFGYEPAVIDKFLISTGGALIDDHRWAVRGREQLLIDALGGVGSPNVGNRINGISPYNPFRMIYISAANMYFGP